VKVALDTLNQTKTNQKLIIEFNLQMVLKKIQAR
jgi:hypothetical protein